jgi:glycosyltransferase involved in cell wall biosynthesis
MRPGWETTVSRVRIVLHSFGDQGSGGPITTLGRVLESPLAEKYDFVRMHQSKGAGGINFRLLRQWVSLLRKVRPDLVHVMGLGNEGFHGVLASRLAGCPRILVSIHGTVRDVSQTAPSLRRSTLVSVIEPATLRMATHIATVCNSAAQREFLDPYRSKMAGVIPNGVYLPDEGKPLRSVTRTELGLRDDTLACVVVGRLSIEKGHLVLAKALQRLPQAGVKITLLIVGDGPDRTTIERAYAEVPGVDVQFLGRRFDVPAILEASDLFLFPTLHENLSNALLEAMAAGLPVIASAVGGNVEVLTRGGGVLVPVSDPTLLADSMVTLLGDAGLRARYGSEARTVVQDHYTVDHMIAGLDNLYERVLHEGTHP